MERASLESIKDLTLSLADKGWSKASIKERPRPRVGVSLLPGLDKRVDGAEGGEVGAMRSGRGMMGDGDGDGG